MIRMCGRFHCLFYKDVAKEALVIKKYLDCKEEYTVKESRGQPIKGAL